MTFTSLSRSALWFLTSKRYWFLTDHRVRLGNNIYKFAWYSSKSVSAWRARGICWRSKFLKYFQKEVPSILWEYLRGCNSLDPYKIGITLASGHLLPYRGAAHRILSHLLPAKEPAAAYITFSTLRPNETVKISPSKSGDSADMADSQPQSKLHFYVFFNCILIITDL